MSTKVTTFKVKSKSGFRMEEEDFDGMQHCCAKCGALFDLMERAFLGCRCKCKTCGKERGKCKCSGGFAPTRPIGRWGAECSGCGGKTNGKHWGLRACECRCQKCGDIRDNCRCKVK